MLARRRENRREMIFDNNEIMRTRSRRTTESIASPVPFVSCSEKGSFSEIETSHSQYPGRIPQKKHHHTYLTIENDSQTHTNVNTIMANNLSPL